jgi:hypothetical protein
MKNKVLALVMCLCIFVSLTACGRPDIIGDNLVMQAREDYEQLDSAQVEMTNTETGKVEQTFTFKYSSDGVLTYKDWKLVDGEENIEFNNGETNVYLKGGKYYQYNQSDEKFVKYTRTRTHKKTRYAMLTYIPSAITDARMQHVDDKNEVTHIYDVSKVNPSVPQGAKATGFAVRFVFKKSGELENFTETTIYELDGKETRVAYKTEIKQKNSVGEIENIITQQE